jgi:hypothetical protein
MCALQSVCFENIISGVIVTMHILYSFAAFFVGKFARFSLATSQRCDLIEKYRNITARAQLNSNELNG